VARPAPAAGAGATAGDREEVGEGHRAHPTWVVCMRNKKLRGPESPA
jgi:hypothetical protein